MDSLKVKPRVKMYLALATEIQLSYIAFLYSFLFYESKLAEFT